MIGKLKCLLIFAGLIFSFLLAHSLSALAEDQSISMLDSAYSDQIYRFDDNSSSYAMQFAEMHEKKTALEDLQDNLRNQIIEKKEALKTRQDNIKPTFSGQSNSSLIASVKFSDAQNLLKGTPVENESGKQIAISSKTSLSEDQKLDQKLRSIAESGSGTVPVVIVLVEQPTINVSKKVQSDFAPMINRLSGIRRDTLARMEISPEVIASGNLSEIFKMVQEEHPDDIETLNKTNHELSEIRMQMRKEILVQTQLLANKTQEAILKDLASNGATIISINPIYNSIAAIVPISYLKELSKNPSIARIWYNQEGREELDDSSPSIYAPSIWIYGFTGYPYRAAVVDGGIQATHPALEGKIVNSQVFHDAAKQKANYNTSVDQSVFKVYSGHGTLIAGIIASQDSTYRGIAYGANLLNAKASYFGTDEEIHIIDSDVMNATTWAWANGADVISYSLGGKTGVDGETGLCHFMDYMVDVLGLPVVKSAGNEGPTPKTITDPGPAYNVITVGNIDDQGDASRSNDVIRSSSSRGPTGDGRLKPDIAAPGTEIMSCLNTWTPGNEWISETGTSYAAPHISAAVLLTKGFMGFESSDETNMALAIKAELLNTAEDVSAGEPGPDFTYGYGYVDLYQAYLHRNDVVTGSLNTGQPDFYKLVASSGDTATLVYNRHINYNEAQYSAVKLSNLNISIFDESNGQLIQKNIEPNNNTKQVRSDKDYSSEIVKISADIFAPGITGETYALAAKNSVLKVNPPNFIVSLFAPSSIISGSIFDIKATVTNNGDINAHSPNIHLSLPSGFTIVQGLETQSLGMIEGNSAKTEIWTVQAATSNSPTTYTISCEVSSNSYDELYTASESKSTIIKPIWSSLGGYVNSSPSVIVDSQGKSEAWVIGGDNALWANIDGSWLGAGGILTSEPFAAEDYNGRIHVLARGGDYAVWDYIYDPANASGHWLGLGGYVTEALTAAMDPANHNIMRIAAKGGDNALWTCDLDINEETSSWIAQGGIITSRPFLMFDPSGREHILVRGGDNALWDKNGVWSGSVYTRTWSPLGGLLANKPIATIQPGVSDHIAVFVKGGDNALWMCDVNSASNPETSAWYGFGGSIHSDPFAVADVSWNKIYTFVRGGDSALWENTFSTTPWNPGVNVWKCLGGSILDYMPGGTIGDDIQTFVVGTDHALWRNTQADMSVVCPMGCKYSSIQAAIDTAIPGDTITVAAGTYVENVHIDKSLTIIGAGEDKTIVNGNQAGSVFTIEPYIDVTISGMTIQNGNASFGGGILNGGNLRISDCTITRNKALHQGCGFYISRGRTEISGCTISENTPASDSITASGGGIYCLYTANMVINDRCSIKLNHASGGAGGIACQGYTEILDSTIYGNTADGSAGGIDASGHLTMKRCNISMNSAAGNGGGLFIIGNTVYDNGTIIGNTAKNGAGIYNDYRCSYGTCLTGHLTLTNSSVKSNTATNLGGGLYNAGEILPPFNQSQIQDNSPDDIYPNTIADVEIPNLTAPIDPLNEVEIPPISGQAGTSTDENLALGEQESDLIDAPEARSEA